MSTTYQPPQRSAARRLARFVRRATETINVESIIQTGILASFAGQRLLEGERRTVSAQYVSSAQWLPVSAQFTLLAAGAVAAGYNSVSGSFTSDSTERVWTITAVIDLSADAAHPLEPGDYEGEFLLTTSAGEILAARGRITIESITSNPGSNPEPDTYTTTGGLN